MATTIVSFSSTKEFAGELDLLMHESGYTNRSRFLRDAAIRYAEIIKSGDISDMKDELEVDGTLIVYYQHEVGKNLEKYRHTEGIQTHSFIHACLKSSHTCVDTMQINGQVGAIRELVTELKQTTGVDRVEFLVSPRREHGCC